MSGFLLRYMELEEQWQLLDFARMHQRIKV